MHPRHLTRRPFAALLVGSLVACQPQDAPPMRAASPGPSMTAAPAAAGGSRCGDVVGAWSSVVDGLRGRLVTSGSRPDGSALRVTLELENVSGQGALELHWSGRPDVGFATFRLDDAAGAEVPEPAWRFGGNEPSGDIRALVPPTGAVAHIVADNVFTSFSGGRVLRIGAFWGREAPFDGARRFLRARVAGSAPKSSEGVLSRGEDGSLSVRASSASDLRGRVWTGPLDVPGVCLD